MIIDNLSCKAVLKINVILIWFKFLIDRIDAANIQHFSRSWLSCVDSIIQFNSIMFQPGLLHDHIMIVHIKLIQRMLITANYSTSLNNITLPVKIVISVNGWIFAAMGL